MTYKMKIKAAQIEYIDCKVCQSFIINLDCHLENKDHVEKCKLCCSVISDLMLHSFSVHQCFKDVKEWNYSNTYMKYLIS